MSLKRLALALVVIGLLSSPIRAVSGRVDTVHLELGNPTNADTNPAQPLNYLIDRPQYALSYNRDKGTANWVSWHLDSADLGSAPRSTSFTTDTSLPVGWYRVKTSDYTNSGFDRGHMCPSADRTATVADNEATFIMTNIIPQAPDNNQGPWADLEDYSRSLVGQSEELYIVSGGDGVSGTIGSGNVTVPSGVWKVVVALPVGDDDAGRINTATRVFAVRLPNINGIRATAWQDYLVTVDSIEATTGFDFLSNVPAPIQNVIEDRLDIPTAAVAITATTGITQSAALFSAFSTPMQVLAVDSQNVPVAGITVTFAALGLYATGTFPTGHITATATTDASGVATAPIFAANGSVGNYVVEASTAGVYTPATFFMINLPANWLNWLYLPVVIH